MVSKLLEAPPDCRRITWPGPARSTAAPILPPSADDPHPLESRLLELEAGFDRSVKESYEAGRAQGESAGRELAQAEVRDLLERLAHTIAELAQVRAQIYKEAEPDLVKLSLEVARRILRRELTVDPATVTSLIDAAIQKLQGQLVHRVRVHPDHAEIVRASVHQFSAGAEVQVVADPSREPGTVIFELENGSLDASLETQLREIERGLATQSGSAQ